MALTMLTNTEADQLYEVFAAALAQQGLQWVVDQVAEQIRYGKLEEAEVEERSFLLLEEQDLVETGQRRRRRGSKIKLMKTLPYSPQERLRLMVDAVERITSHVLKLEETLTQFFENDNAAPKQIVFVPEEQDGTKEFIVDIHEVRRRADGVRRLMQLLTEVRSEGDFKESLDAH